MTDEMTTMKISKRNRDRVAKFGVAGETLDVALTRAMDKLEDLEYEKLQRKNKINPLRALISKSNTA